MRTNVLAWLLALVSASTIQAQTRLASASPFSLWLGEWKGSGWSVGANGERTEFELTESVKERSGGTVLFVEGHGTRTTGSSRGSVSHDGVVFVYRDKAGKLKWNGHEAASGAIDAEVTLRDGGFEWSFDADNRGTVVRFVITLDATHWRETGEVSADGRTWARFMEMSLVRD
jgi:hypothetical protein